MKLCASAAIALLTLPLLLFTGCHSEPDFTGFYNPAHPPKDISGSSRFKVEKKDGNYLYVPIVNNKFHQCVPNTAMSSEAHLATSDELIGLTDKQDNSGIQALVAKDYGYYIMFGPKGDWTVHNVHAASGIIFNDGTGGVQEAARTKQCIPFP